MQLISEILILGFFAFFLLSILRFKPGYFKYYPASFQKISLGLFILILVLAFKMINNFWDFTPESYLKASMWVGIILGGVYMIWGFLHLFFMGSKSQADFLHRMRQVVCFKAIASIPIPSKSYEQILKESLNKLMDIMKFKMGIVFKPSFNSHDMVLVGYWGVPSERVNAILSLPKDNGFYKEAIMSHEVVAYDEVNALPEYNHLFTEEDEIHSFAAVPLKFGGKNLGVIGLYDTNPKRFVYQETLFLTSLGKLLGVMAEQTLKADRNKWRREYICVADKISRIFQLDSPMEKSISRMAKLLRKVIQFDYLSLAITDTSLENMQRISVGSGGNLLLSKEHSLPTRGTAVLEAIKTSRPLIHREIEDGKYMEENLLKAMGIKSRLILPLSRYGALTFGSLKTGNYQHKDAKWMNLIGSVLTNVLIDREMREMISKKDNLLMKLKEITDETLVEKGNEKIFSDIARNITEQLPTSFCRISLLGKDRNNLNTIALEKIRDQGIKLKDENTHPLSLLPWHRMVLETGRTMLVNQEDPESLMPDEECEEIMSKDLRSGILVPIIKDQDQVGVLSVGEMRSWNRRPFGQEEVAFVKSLANQIPLILEKNYRNSSSASNIGSEQGKRLNQLGFDINSSLSTIFGSVELLKSKKKNLDGETSKYLDVIEKGGQRIQKSFKGYLKPQQSEVSKVKKDLVKQKVTA